MVKITSPIALNRTNKTFCRQDWDSSALCHQAIINIAYVVYIVIIKKAYLFKNFLGNSNKITIQVPNRTHRTRWLYYLVLVVIPSIDRLLGFLTLHQATYYGVVIVLVTARH